MSTLAGVHVMVEEAGVYLAIDSVVLDGLKEKPQFCIGITAGLAVKKRGTTMGCHTSAIMSKITLAIDRSKTQLTGLSLLEVQWQKVPPWFLTMQ